MWNIDGQELLHTEEVKKRYSNVEREIKRQLTELLLLNNISAPKYICRWLSITKNFKIRELTPAENSKFLSNPSTIKSPVLNLTVDSVKMNLFELIDENVQEQDIANKYKLGITEFLWWLYIWNMNKIRSCWESFRKYLSQAKKNCEWNIWKYNVQSQVAKILYSKLWDKAFDYKENENWWKTIILSELSLNYIQKIFYNANLVWEKRWKSLDKVFHDSDFPFIAENIKATENDYIDAIVYLVNKWKLNYYGKRWENWKNERSKKTSQYADILWALTNNQLWIQVDDNKSLEFQWDTITQNLYKIWWWILENEVNTYNDSISSKWKILSLDKRLKSLSSSTEKIIEWKKINDAIWLRVSTTWIDKQDFDNIKNISKNWFTRLRASLRSCPTKYVPEWYTICIKEVTVDNKDVISPKQMNIIISELNKIIPTKKREKIDSPYINQKEWENRIQSHYPEKIQDTVEKELLQTFFQKISWWKARWVNWWYKDFKYNIVFEIKDKTWNATWERTMEVQFDDINNGKWLANYNIRNFERWLNTQSRLSFSVTLANARKNCETNLKKMWLWANKWTQNMDEEAKKEFFQIKFDDWSVIDISDFRERTQKNSKKLDEAIIKIINYFLYKWTLILCCRDNEIWEEWNKQPLPKKEFTIDDLKNTALLNDIRFCSSFELSLQQHSYLQKNWDANVWIYIPNKQRIWWIKLGELINPMNLWKKKDPQFSAKV